MKAKMIDLGILDDTARDKLIAFLEKLSSANVHLPLLEGPRSGSGARDEGTSPDDVPAQAEMFSTSPHNHSPTSELSTDVRSVLLGSDDAGPANESVYDGQSEEEGTIEDLYEALDEVCVNRGMILKLLKSNTKLGGAILRRIIEVKYGNE